MLLNILSNGDKHTSTSVLYVQRYHIRENSESYTECTSIYTGVIKKQNKLQIMGRDVWGWVGKGGVSRSQFYIHMDSI